MSKEQFVLPIRERNADTAAKPGNVSHLASPKSFSPTANEYPPQNGTAIIQKPKAVVEYDVISLSHSSDLSPLVSPVGSSNQGTGLPPTPPSMNALDLAGTPENGTQTIFGDRNGLIINNRPSFTTPVNQRSPPTPDPSPPRANNSLQTPVPPPTLRYPSSRAESFKTAREEQWSTNSEASQSQRSLLASPQIDRYQNLPLRYQDESLQDASNWLRNGARTPTQAIASANSSRSVQADSSPRVQSSTGLQSIPDREWNTELMKNATVRRNDRPKTPERRPGSSTQSTPPSSAKRHFSTHKRLERFERDRDLDRPRVSTSGNESSPSSNWPNEVDSLLDHHLRDGEGKRNSTASSASTVVEAVVVVTPPRKLQPLRHAGKNLALRGADCSPSSNPQAARLNLGSSTTEDIPLHRLIHKRSRIPDRRNRNSSESETSAKSAPSMRVVSQPAAPKIEKRQERVAESLRPRAVSSPVKNLYPSPLPTNKSIRGYFDMPHRNSEANGETPGTSSALFQYISPYSQNTSQSQHSSPRLQHKTRNVSSPTHSSSPDVLPLQRNDSRPSTSHRSLGAHEDAIERAQSAARAISLHMRSISSPMTGLPSSPPKGSSSFLDSPVPSERRSPHETERTFLHSPALSERTVNHQTRNNAMVMSPDSPRRIKRVSLAPTEDLPRRSFDDNGSRTDDNKRVSMASTARTDEHALARHLYAQNTPFSFSQFSTTPDALEVSEATAISIFPHNNNSLLVIQQVARSNTISDENTPSIIQEMLAPPLPQPALTFEPSTPPQISSGDALVDSPLRNPRKPPSPPVIQFIPPTPAEELERELDGPTHLGVLPKRRASLKERARRYSDNYIAPMFTRTPSKARRTASNPPIRRVPSVTEQHGNLHPFWRPRGFWDGFEDTTNSEDSFEDDDVLPSGGDTSDIIDSEKKLPLARRLTNSFRGSGGFLIGNSLGMERQGTNKRRHHILVPPNFGGNRREVGNSPVRSNHPALNPLGRIEKRIFYANSNRSMSNASTRFSRWRKVHKIPGLGINVQYVGFQGMKDKLREKRAEKRREAIRQSIGPRLYVEGSRVV